MSRMGCKEFTLEMVLELSLAESDRGVLESWSVGVLECWSVGVLECWSVGVLECWSVGRRDLGGATVSFS